MPQRDLLMVRRPVRPVPENRAESDSSQVLRITFNLSDPYGNLDVCTTDETGPLDGRSDDQPRKLRRSSNRQWVRALSSNASDAYGWRRG
jgi:hypothetical protein